jgi:LacI family transcriptional regulator
MDRIKTTLKDIAQKTGLSVNTISRALKDKEDIAEATRKMIQSIAKEMGYVGNSLAGSLRSG